MFSILFLQESLFREAVHSLHSCFLIQIGCLLHIIKDSATLDNNVSTELTLEQCVETLNVLT